MFNVECVMFKETKIMKALRYLLIVMAMVSFLGVNAQGLAQQPKVQMRSTSGMVFSGSQLPSAAERGTYVTGTVIGTYNPSNASGPNRAKKEDDGWADEDDTPGQGDVNPDLPGDLVPLGDAALPLALLACTYVLFRYVRTRKRA